MSFKNPVFISHNGLKPHVNYGTSFTFQDSGNLVSIHMSWGCTYISAGDPAVVSWGDHLSEMTDEFPSSPDGALSSAIRHAFWMAPILLQNTTEEKQSLPRLDCFFILCKALAKSARKKHGWLRNFQPRIKKAKDEGRRWHSAMCPKSHVCLLNPLLQLFKLFLLM